MKNGNIKIFFFISFFLNEECRCSRDLENYQSGVRDQIVLSIFNRKQQSQRIGTAFISLSEENNTKRVGENRYELEFYLKTKKFKMPIHNPLIVKILYQKRVRLLSPTQGSIYEYKIDSIDLVNRDCLTVCENKGWLSSYTTNRNVDAKIFL